MPTINAGVWSQEALKRRESGRAARKKTSRKAQAALGNVDRDPVKLLRLSSEGRVERLIPLRYGRMAASPFAFFRGSAILQAHDLAGTPDSGFDIQICGDAHLANFGAFATPERHLLFDVNDFDETSIGPWEWDIKRLMASAAVAARHLRIKRGVADEIVSNAVKKYREHMARYAQMGTMACWYNQITFERLLEEFSEPEAQKRIRKGMEQAMGRSHERLLPKLGEKQDGRWTIRDAPPVLFHVRGENTLFSEHDEWLVAKNWEQIKKQAFAGYIETLSNDRQHLLSRFHFQDAAFKVVGVGSVGTRCLILLMVDDLDSPLFLQVKEATRSVVARFRQKRSAKKNFEEHQGRRVVEGQRLMQAASDLFLGWTEGPSGRHFYLRQLRDMKLSVSIDLMDAETLKDYVEVCAQVLARAHAKASGKALEISGYMGSSESMDEALAQYAQAYADQVEKDYDRFLAACRSGQLSAKTDADMEGDFRV